MLFFFIFFYWRVGGAHTWQWHCNIWYIFVPNIYTFLFRNWTFDSDSSMACGVNYSEILLCGLCLGEKIQPKYLNCHHSFCTECLEVYYQGAATIECPTCRKGTRITNGIAKLVDDLEYPDSKVHGANMGPTWGRQDLGGLHVDPMNLAMREYFQPVHTPSNNSFNTDNIGNRRHESFQIFVRDINGRSKTFDVKDTDLIEDLKREVHKKFGIPSAKQRLLYHGKQLEEGKRLSFYKISRGSTISLVLYLSSSPKTGYGEIAQSLEDGKLEKRQSLRSSASNTLLNTDDSGNKRNGSFRIFVKNIDGTYKMFIVKDTDFIQDLKIKIHEKIGIPSDKQRLIYYGKRLEDGKRLSFYKISKGSTTSLLLRILSSPKTGYCDITEGLEDIKLKKCQSLSSSVSKTPLSTDASDNRENGSFQILVNGFDGTSTTFTVKKTDFIEDLKRKIHEKIRIPSDKQRLIHSNKRLEDGKRLSFYKISKGSTISLLLLMSSSPKTGSCDIAECLEDRKLEKCQSLSSSVSKNPLNTDASDNRENESFQILVNGIDGISTTFTVKETDFIKDLKRKIHEKIGIPSDKQHLIHSGKRLEDGKRLSFYKISNGSTISLLLLILSSPKTGCGDITQSLGDRKLKKCQSSSSSTSKAPLNTENSGNRGNEGFHIFTRCQFWPSDASVLCVCVSICVCVVCVLVMSLSAR